MVKSKHHLLFHKYVDKLPDLSLYVSIRMKVDSETATMSVYDAFVDTLLDPSTQEEWFIKRVRWTAMDYVRIEINNRKRHTSIEESKIDKTESSKEGWMDRIRKEISEEARELISIILSVPEDVFHFHNKNRPTERKRNKQRVNKLAKHLSNTAFEKAWKELDCLLAAE